MTPNQRNQLRQMRDRGYRLDGRVRIALIRDGHLTGDDVIITDPDSFGALLVGEQILLLARDHTTGQIGERLGLSANNIKAVLYRHGVQAFRQLPTARKQLRKARILMGDLNEVQPEVAALIIRRAAASGITFIAAAAQIIAGSP